MGYVDYNLELYRQGYRPYGETDPFAATTLSGYAPSMSRGPMGPWELRGLGSNYPWELSGLGQNHPFTERGGWALHGLARCTLGFLGDVVPDQSIVTYTGTWVPHGTQGATDVIGQVSSILAGEGLSVRSVSSSAYRFLVNNTFNVKLVIQVSNGMGYGAPSDIASVVDNAAWQITGSMPLASSISSVQIPNAPVPVPTGQPEIPDTGTGSGQQPSQPGQPSDWFANNAVTLALVTAGLLVGVPILKRVIG